MQASYLRNISLFMLVFAISLCCMPSRAAVQLPLLVTANGECGVSAAFDGTNYLVALETDIAADRSGMVAAQLMSQTGQPVGSLITTGQTVSLGGGGPFVAFDGANYLLVWETGSQDQNDIYAQFVSTAGALIGSAFPICNDAGAQGLSGKDPIVFTGTKYLITWSDRSSASVQKLRGRLVSPAGGLGAAFDIDSTNRYTYHAYSVAGDGVGAFVVWEATYAPSNLSLLKGRFVAANGTLSAVVTIDATGQAIAAGQDAPLPEVAFDGTNYLVARTKRTAPADLESDWNITGRFVSPAGTLIGSSFSLVAGTGDQWLPFLAFDGTHYLFTWGDLNGTPVARGRFYSPAGSAVGAAFTITGTLDGKSSPGAFILFDGMRYFAVATAVSHPEQFDMMTGDVYASFLGKYNGTLFPIATTSGGEFLANIASDGTNLLAGIEGDAGFHSNITAQRLSPNGTLIGGRIAVGRTGGVPHVAFGGTRYLLVWSDDANYPANDIYGQFINPNGTLSGSAFPICQAAGRQELEGLRCLLFDGTNFLVVWSDFQLAGTVRLFGQFVSQAGALVGAAFEVGASTNGGTENRMENAMAFDGTRYLIIWQNKDTPESLNTVHGRFIAKNRTLSATFIIGQTPQQDRNPVNVLFDGTRYLAVWNEGIAGGPLDVDGNLIGRFITPAGAFPGAAFPVTTSPGEQAIPGIAFDGSHYLVTWTNNFMGPNVEIFGRFFDTTFAPLGPEFPVLQGIGEKIPFTAGVMSNGSTFLIFANYITFDPQNMPDGPDFTDGDVWGAFVAPPVVPQPDLQIKNSADSAYIGDNIYNVEASQTRMQTKRTGETAIYHLKIQNDGQLADTFKVTGTAGGSGWTVNYFDALTGGSNITTAVTSTTGWSTGLLAINGVKDIRVEVTGGATILSGTTKTVRVSAASMANTAKTDTVKANTTKAALSAVTLAANPPSPKIPNTSITLTGAAIGGGAIQYKFRAGYLNSGVYTWSYNRDWSTAATCTWVPTLAKTYLVEVYARQTGTTPEVTANISYQINLPMSAVNLITDVPSPRPINTSIRLTGVATGGGTVEYKFRVGYVVNSVWTWTTLRGYGTYPSSIWRPTVARTYTLQVWAREQGSTASYQKLKSISYVIKPALTAVSVSASPVSPQPVNTAIVLTATRTGGANVQYQYRVGYNNNGAWTWTTIRPYGTSPTCTWRPTVARTYTVQVWAREIGSTVQYQTAGALSYTVTAQ